MIVNIGEWIVNIIDLDLDLFSYTAVPATGIKAENKEGWLYSCKSAEEAEKRVREIFA